MQLKDKNYPNLRLVIGIAGKARSGKDTVAGALVNELCTRGEKVHIHSLAMNLKQQCADALHIDIDVFYASKYKELFRPLLQWWGTDYRRNESLNELHQRYHLNGGPEHSNDYWIDSLCATARFDATVHYS